jgi:putative selenate reductase
VISFDDSIELCRRLTAFATQRGRRVGFKFSNTLEVLNERDFFPARNEVMYLSGQPLYVIAITLADDFRQAVGPDVPISFSAAIDKQNFPTTAACGLTPITTSTDLLRPGGYGRLPSYLHRLADDMKDVEAGSLGEFVLRRFGQGDEARQRAVETTGSATVPEVDEATVRWAGWLNTSIAARLAREDPRYRKEQNTKVPKRIGTHLVVFDCVTCDKCLPVCPNAANFKYPTPTTNFTYQDLAVVDGEVKPVGEARELVIDKKMQIACYADFCNECGNCDTFCPEYGGPYIEKPSFFGSAASWRRAAPRDGFYVDHGDGRPRIVGRVNGAEYWLEAQSAAGQYRFRDGIAEIATRHEGDRITDVQLVQAPSGEHRINMWAYHTMRYLLHGVLDTSRVNQVNVALLITAGRQT